jgi:hypothetical protein
MKPSSLVVASVPDEHIFIVFRVHSVLKTETDISAVITRKTAILIFTTVKTSNLISFLLFVKLHCTRRGEVANVGNVGRKYVMTNFTICSHRIILLASSSYMK